MFWPLVKLPSIEFWRFYAFWTLHFKSMFQQNSSPVNTHLQINSENLWIYILCVWGRTESRHLKNIFKDHFHCFGNVFSNITLKIGKDETTLMHNLSCTPKYDTHKPGFLAYLGWNSQLLMYSHGVIIDDCGMAEVILFQYLSPKFLLKGLSCSLPKTDRAQSDPTDLFLLANFQLFSYILSSNHTSLLAVLWKHRGSFVHQGLCFGCFLLQDKSYLTYSNSSFLHLLQEYVKKLPSKRGLLRPSI